MVQERRWQPLLEQWCVIAAASSQRPWSGAVVAAVNNDLPVHDPECYLCPRVERANGKVNPDYIEPFAFFNDFASLVRLDAVADASNEMTEQTTSVGQQDGLRRTGSSGGICKVLCWSERHNATLATLSEIEMQRVARLWQSEYIALSAHEDIENVLIFENKGKETGVSNLHPHGQIYATAFLTETATRMRQSQHRYMQKHQRSMLQDLIGRPEYSDELLVEQSQHFVTVVPFAARFAYESWIIPTRHVSSIADMSNAELDELALVYQRQAKRYDTLFRRPSPNVTLLHNAPCDKDGANDDWCFHIAMQPPLRDPDKLKYLAGFESGSANIINPVPPEVAASQLRQCDEAPNTSALIS